MLSQTVSPDVVVVSSPAGSELAAVPSARPKDLQRTARLALATVWLLDAVLQIQPFMFTPGANGFSGMIGGLGTGNPGWVARTITWNASIVDHHPVLTNTAFALVQFLIGFGLVNRRTLKPALALSIAWSLAVWWFGEGLGGVFSGAGSPFGGAPGGVLFYAVIAVLVWPSARPEGPFVAAKALGAGAARAVWAALWAVLAVLSVAGPARSPKVLHDLVSGMMSGQPGWLVHLDKYSATFFLQHGEAAAIGLAILCVLVGASAYAPVSVARFAVVVAIVAFACIWVAVQDFGGILAGGATDPNSGLLVVLLCLLFWPLGPVAEEPVTAGGHPGRARPAEVGGR